MNEYLKGLNRKEAFDDLASYAHDFDVPIIQPEGLLMLEQVIELTHARRILEIGTAIGYSALHMAIISDDITVDTIERDPEMLDLAQANILKYNMEARIRVFFEDALTIDLSKFSESYDLIFIDAAKAQYVKFFEKFTRLLKRGGVVVTDNILFHDLIGTDIGSKNLRSMVNKIDAYNHWLKDLPDYRTTFFPLGDGLAISERIK
jgi:predicted O-methyltransferase YrrM